MTKLAVRVSCECLANDPVSKVFNFHIWKKTLQVIGACSGNNLITCQWTLAVEEAMS